MKIVLVCGYRRTGKDTLCKQLQGTSEVPFNWLIYRRPGAHLFPNWPARRVAFADILKDEVEASIKEYLPPGFDRERDKEKPLATGKSFRQHCIDLGREKRAIDPFYWAKLAFSSVGLDESIIVTDWRYPHELEYAKRFGEVTTIRVYRSSVPHPDPKEDSEHSLDPVSTDFLLVTSEKDFADALQYFPFYSGFN